MENPNCLAISMSWGGTSARANFENALNIARTQARGGKGIPCFASSGNGYATEFSQYPAAYNAVWRLVHLTRLMLKPLSVTQVLSYLLPPVVHPF
jgi:hypothetical protein